MPKCDILGDFQTQHQIVHLFKPYEINFSIMYVLDAVRILDTLEYVSSSKVLAAQYLSRDFSVYAVCIPQTFAHTEK